MIPTHSRTAALGAALLALTGAGAAQAQALTVLPVTIQMTPDQMAVSLTVINQGTSQTSVQVRAFAWGQTGPEGQEVLTATDAVQASPPLATIAPAAAQVIRLVMRRPVRGKEQTYRILLDQVPSAGEPGAVQIALRMSIPVFAEPKTRATAHVQYRIERAAGMTYLVAANDGDRHETLRDISLTNGKGDVVRTETNASPYVLADATRRWRILEPSQLPAAGEVLRLTAKGQDGLIDQRVSVPQS